MDKKTKRKLGVRYKCVICRKYYKLKAARQLTCSDKCSKQLPKKRKKTDKYKKWQKEYYQDWYNNNGGKKRCADWKKKHREKINEQQRIRRYGRKMNKKGTRAEALKLGYRSMSEVVFSEDLRKRKINFDYEIDTFIWQPPKQKYTPDFLITKKNGKSFYVEYKGRLTNANRRLLLCIKKQHPDLDLRLVFDYPKGKIYKGSKTTYAEWAKQHNFKWAEKIIPEEWLNEV